HAGPLLADPRQRPGVRHHIGPPAAVNDGHRHAKQPMLPRQGHDPVVEPPPEVALLLDRPQGPAEGLDVLQQPVSFRAFHEVTPRPRLSTALRDDSIAGGDELTSPIPLNNRSKPHAIRSAAKLQASLSRMFSWSY